METESKHIRYRIAAAYAFIRRLYTIRASEVRPLIFANPDQKTQLHHAEQKLLQDEKHAAIQVILKKEFPSLPRSFLRTRNENMYLNVREVLREPQAVSEWFDADFPLRLTQAIFHALQSSHPSLETLSETEVRKRLGSLKPPVSAHTLYSVLIEVTQYYTRALKTVLSADELSSLSIEADMGSVGEWIAYECKASEHWVARRIVIWARTQQTSSHPHYLLHT